MTGTSQKTRRVLVTEIGNRNTGDEVQIASTIRHFAEAGWNVSLLCRVKPRPEVYAGHPVEIHDLVVEDFFDDVSSAGDLVAAFAGRHPDAYRHTCKLVTQHDLVAVAPGGRFTSGYNNPRALLTAAVAQNSGIPVVNLHQSVGPLDRQEHRRLVAEIFSKATLNLARDDRSFDFLQRLGVPRERLVLTRDISFGEEFAVNAGVNCDVGINIRCGFNGRVNLEILREFLIQLGRSRPGLRILIYSTTHTPGGDVFKAADGLAEVERELPRWDECLRLPASCSVNISDSFHGAIFSMIAGRPVICCQTDYSSWKIEGMSTPDCPGIEVMPGFVSRDEIASLLARTLDALDNPHPIIATQNRRVEHARMLCARGWQALDAVLQSFETERGASCA